MLYAMIAAVLVAQGTEPAADVLSFSAENKEPFSFFRVPSDVVGFKDCPEGFQLTFDGALNNGFGELDFEIGTPLKRVNQRVKTLYRNRLPIPEFECVDGNVHYRFTFWGMPDQQNPQNDLVGFVRVVIDNQGKTTAKATLGAKYGPKQGHARAALPCTEWYQNRFMDATAFQSGSTASAKEGKAWKNGHLVFAYSPGAKKESGDSPAVVFDYQLNAKEKRTVEFKVPYVPVSQAKAPVVEQVVGANTAKAWTDTVRFWTDLQASATQIELPESKVTDTVYAGLFYLLIARDISEDGKHFIQKVNEFQYDDFYPRDTAYISRTYDMMGLPKTALETIQEYVVRNEQGRVDGFKRLHPDDWGQSLWAMGSHYRLTGDRAFAKDIYQGVANHVQGYKESIADDPLKLWPATIAYDNELINGHYTGHNFWAILGLKEIESMARSLGHSADAMQFMNLAATHKMRLLARLEELTKTTGGYIPPGLDKPEDGFDWENATGGVYPFGILDPMHPWVTATVRTVREYKWREGISTWGPNGWMLKQSVLKGIPTSPGSIHHYQTFNVDEVLLARNEQRDVIEDLYSVLAHTSSTHAGFEMSMDPWGDRDPQGNYPPHGWFAARYIEYIRNLMVRESGESLVIASALSPEWVKAGKVIKVRNAPTDFGLVSFTLQSKKDGAELKIEPNWRMAPNHLRLNRPWFVDLQSVVVDGKPVPLDKTGVNLPSDAKRVSLKWKWIEEPNLSYKEAVRLWLEKNYHFDATTDRDFLFPRPSRPKIDGVQRAFVDSCEVRLLDPSGKGKVHFTLDGSEPTEKSPVYQSPIKLTEETKIRAFVVWPDGRRSEPIDKVIYRLHYDDEPVDKVESGYSVASWLGDFDKLPDLNTKPDKVSAAQTIELADIEPRADFFAIHVKGFIRVPKDGVYSFAIGSDDGSRLWIANRLLCDNDGLHAYKEVTGDIALRKGIYPIAIAYFNKDGARYMRLFWEGPGIAKQRIPKEALVN